MPGKVVIEVEKEDTVMVVKWKVTVMVVTRAGVTVMAGQVVILVENEVTAMVTI